MAEEEQQQQPPAEQPAEGPARPSESQPAEAQEPAQGQAPESPAPAGEPSPQQTRSQAPRTEPQSPPAPEPAAGEPQAEQTQPPEGEATGGAQTVSPAPPSGQRGGRGGQFGGPSRQGGGRTGGRGQGGARGGRGGRGRDRDRDRGGDDSGVESSVVRIYRCSKVVKGGRTFSFGALVVAGDRRGNVGIGYGKANEVPMAVEKATKDARKQMIKVNLKGSTIPHSVKGTAGASTVVMIPARPGTGVTAGKSVRPLIELSGITDILTKAYGSTAPKNLVKATMAALQQLQQRDQVEQFRGVSLPSGAGELVTT